jgi:hypothetical protein
VALRPSARTSAALLACVLAATAGCSGTLGDVTSTPSYTPAPVPSAGVADRSALLRTHESSLANRSCTVTTRTRITFENGSTYRASDIRRRVAADDTRYLTARFRGPGFAGATASPAVRPEQWTNGSVSLGRWTYANGGHRFERTQPYGPPSAGTSWLAGVDDGSTVRVERRSDAVVLTQRREFRGFAPGEPRGEATLRAVLGPDSRVRSTRVRSPVRVAGANATAVFRTDVSNVGGTAVRTPPWFEDAAAATRDEAGTGARTETRTATEAA